MNIRTLDLNLLVVFSALIQERSVTRAAESLNMAQPSVSHALKRLRTALRDPLFIRTAKGMEPTPFALRLAPSVLRSLEGLKEGLKHATDFAPANSRRHFRLLMSDAAQMVILPTLIKHLKKQAPHIKITALALPREQYAHALENDVADLALGNLPLLHDIFYQQRLFNTEYICLMRKKHPLANEKKTLLLKDYLKGRHLAVIRSVGDAMVLRELNKQGLSRNITLEVPSFLAVVQIVQNSDLIATVPYTLIDTEYIKSLINVYCLPFNLPKANVRQFWHQRYHNDPAHRWLRKQLVFLYQD